MLGFDQHVHTCYSGDSEELPEEHIKRGLDIGLKGITFTDHIDYDYPIPPADLFEFDIDKAFKDFKELGEKYFGSFEVGCGIELGLRAEEDIRESMRERLNALEKERDYDLIIGSLHLLDRKDVFYQDYWEGRDPKDCLNEYFDAADEVLKYYDCFDIFGHFDYIIRYAPKEGFSYRPSDYSDRIDSMLKTLIYKGKALEINTKSLKPQYGVGTTNPGPAIIRRYLELGGELITLGSDAHRSADLACFFEPATDMLKSLGVRHYTLYKNRKPVMLPL